MREKAQILKAVPASPKKLNRPLVMQTNQKKIPEPPPIKKPPKAHPKITMVGWSKRTRLMPPSWPT